MSLLRYQLSLSSLSSYSLTTSRKSSLLRGPTPRTPPRWFLCAILVKMEHKQGFFSALKDEVVRCLLRAPSRSKSPARSASPMSSLLRRRCKHHAPPPELFIARSGSLRPTEALSPLKEGPDGTHGGNESTRGEGRWGQWMKGPLVRAPSVSSSSSSSNSSCIDYGSNFQNSN